MVLFSLCNNSYLLLPIFLLCFIVAHPFNCPCHREKWGKGKVGTRLESHLTKSNATLLIQMVLFQFIPRETWQQQQKTSLSTFQHFLKCSLTHYATRIKEFKEIMKPSSIVMLWLRFTLLQLCSACFSGNMLFSPPTQLPPIDNLFLRTL